ncbi:hypothetical protein NDU88_006097 [Pleurodeles waltl]|uniref:Uncharacterized protein n=1 Tax=Pleurodeles waltl TaxID=8319 RepID=A0AAV7WEK2_PLEWA|nr:hypothetical protein NDU88_006097 [Pleurodeles waltl]
MDMLKTSVAILEAKTHKLEAKVEVAEGRARRCNLRIVGFPEGVKGVNVEAFLEDLICKTLPDAPLSAVFVVEHAHMALAAPPPAGPPPRTIIAKVLNYRDQDSPEAAWDWLEQNDETGTPDSLHGESGRRHLGTAEVHTAARRSTRRHRAGRGSRMIVHLERTLSLERHRQEQEEAKLLVPTVTSEASSRSGSPCVTGKLSPEVGTEDT